MALTPEDGTGKSDADSYISQAAATTYFAAHGAPAAWTALSSDAKDAALRYATVTLDGTFDFSANGTVVSSSQALAWPRYGASDEEGRYVDGASVPARIKDATCELALSHLTSALNATVSRGGAVRREKVGPLEVEYEPGAQTDASVLIVGRLVRGLGVRRGGTVEVFRG